MEELKELKKLINKARSHAIKQNELIQDIFKTLDNMEIDIEAETQAYNAGNLSEAITCYISYGEYDVDSIMKEIKKQIEK
jgi:hypothetical protein